mmetsp:Transcript_7990/g.12163  ORF Transcript_7990/g.12163 Transcript_7990/m.12163 type:complete len:600 (-) Transcript_7990:107-1906(-)|eukprot:CAMPEP_0197313746 /NCGR_PEP_ID=MMETSP0891-20130614/30059_1 /TAXON_ID=44058 ORGANISM="Aureoumbra lagunensis, Strain CCMP1510" /NCGR_SAMPLE_ID=MMETSP0891 /ASSEMBLY_ACC=CAM_ASM_000534 /LENGTH=599 /DNA_ID=CAMNT_0042801795 /DNA_START=49 /DNA_END=1848 /DNA_ORIENTATION=-
MSSVDELVPLIKAQGEKVKGLKEAKGDAGAIQEEVAKLLDYKKKLTAIAPEHELAIVDKKKKKKSNEKRSVPSEQGPSKKELRMQERAKKAAEEEAKVKKAAVADADVYGDVPIVMSREMSCRSWTPIIKLDASRTGSTVWVRGRTHAIRGKGNLSFLVLRQATSTIQCVASASDEVPKGLVSYVSKLNLETIVDIQAIIEKAQVASCSQSDVELKILKIFAISSAFPELPFQITDASRNENESKEGEITVGLDTRLNHRVIDLRTPASQAIMRIKAKTALLFANFLDNEGFVGIQTPKLLGGASEGGSSVFNLEYFGRPACLAQSPQLYKQMLAACADFDKVYEIGPVFRAEDSNTRRHLCEFTGMDLEMSIKEHYFEVLDLFGRLFNHIFATLQQQCATELQTISQVYPFEPFLFLKDGPLRISFAEGIQLLREYGITEEQQGAFDDLSTENEKILGDIVKQKFCTDFFIMDKYPLSIRPFYTMPDPITYYDPKCPPEQHLSNSFDMFMRGQEIVSGAQRIHDYKLLLERVHFCHTSASHGGPKPESIQSYLDAFKYGAFPHGGGGIGLERVVMLFTATTNIRKTSFFPRDPTRISP